jgi:hypothetical protein
MNSTKEYITTVRKFELEKHRWTRAGVRAQLSNVFNVSKVIKCQRILGELSKSDINEDFFCEDEEYEVKHILWKIRNNILEFLSDEQQEDIIKNKVYYGTLPLGNLNARCMDSPFNTKILFINIGLFSLVDNIVDFFNCYFYKYQSTSDNNLTIEFNGKDDREHLSNNEEANNKFVNIIVQYCLYGYCGNVMKEDYISDNYFVPEKLWMSRKLMNTIYHFIVTHEYAHVLLNHKKENDTMQISQTEVGEIKISISNPDSHKNEHTADIHAFMMTTLAVSKQYECSPDIAFASVSLFINFMSILHSFRPPKIEDTIYHPHSANRREMLIQLVKMKYTEYYDNSVQLDSNFCETLNLFYEKNWEKITNLLNSSNE